MFELTGGCHCGNVTLSPSLPRPLATYQPRACDCDFCQRHGAAYVSDPAGRQSACVSPKALDPAAKVSRWKSLWIPGVRIETAASDSSEAGSP